jgi:hypothetical protein
VIDFYINGGLRWGVELVRDGRDIGEHARRFGTDGKYAQFAFNDWRVLDFRVLANGEVKQLKNRMTVFFSADFTRVERIYDCTAASNGSLQTEEIPGFTLPL